MCRSHLYSCPTCGCIKHLLLKKKPNEQTSSTDKDRELAKQIQFQAKPKQPKAQPQSVQNESSPAKNNSNINPTPTDPTHDASEARVDSTRVTPTRRINSQSFRSRERETQNDVSSKVFMALLVALIAFLLFRRLDKFFHITTLF